MKKTNEQVRIQDDLFQSVNGEWIKNAVIPNSYDICQYHEFLIP